MADCYYRRITVPSGSGRRKCLQQIHDYLQEARKSQYAEVWIDHGNFPIMCALINGDRGWLMFLRYDGDGGFSSRASDYLGPKDAVADYMLSNGQRDEYPVSWTLPVDSIYRALECFAANKSAPPG
jgi:hypothetical protein